MKDITTEVTGRNGSLAELNDNPKAADRAAGIGRIADPAIHRRRSFLSGKFRETIRELER